MCVGGRAGGGGGGGGSTRECTTKMWGKNKLKTHLKKTCQNLLPGAAVSSFQDLGCPASPKSTGDGAGTGEESALATQDHISCSSLTFNRLDEESVRVSSISLGFTYQICSRTPVRHDQTSYIIKPVGSSWYDSVMTPLFKTHPRAFLSQMQSLLAAVRMHCSSGGSAVFVS